MAGSEGRQSPPGPIKGSSAQMTQAENSEAGQETEEGHDETRNAMTQTENGVGMLELKVGKQITNKQASKQANKQASKQANKQAEQTEKQTKGAREYSGFKQPGAQLDWYVMARQC